MDVTPAKPARRKARAAVMVMAGAGVGLLAHAAVTGPRFEQIVAALGLAAGAAVVGLLVLGHGGLTVTRDDD